jgi:ERF superfamily
VQCSSETIGTIAAALAKAQAQLVNPEKSLVATIWTDEAMGSKRSFRYAPLSSGLDIVHKTLSQHEIATVQTTSIDESAGIVRLSTVLAHASGEWIASDWPVCAISETATPHRMGAALTYARRYALFTLVGIAGEDDLDAPDLVAPKTPASKAEGPTGNKKDHLNGGQEQSARQFSGGRPAKAIPTPSEAILAPEASAALRDQLAAELNEIKSNDEAADWAYRILGAKNSLIAADAACIEEVFRAKLATFATDTPNELEISQEKESLRTRRSSARGKKGRRSSVIDKSTLVLPEPRRIRDRDHVRYVTRQSCLICGRRPSDAHHLRFAQSRALSRKVSDEFTVPLCRGHHREVHHSGDEVVWWAKAGIDPTVLARALWLDTHPLPAVSDKMHVDENSTSGVVNSGDRTTATNGRRPRTRGSNNETKPIDKAAASQ